MLAKGLPMVRSRDAFVTKGESTTPRATIHALFTGARPTVTESTTGNMTQVVFPSTRPELSAYSLLSEKILPFVVMRSLDVRRSLQKAISASLRNSDLAKSSDCCPNLKSPTSPRRIVLNLTAEQREQVATELKRFAGDLNLTDDQKEKLQTALAQAREKVGEYLKNNPTATKADIIAKVRANRDEIRQRVVSFLSPDQLSKWDSEVAKAKEFLGQKLDA